MAEWDRGPQTGAVCRGAPLAPTQRPCHDGAILATAGTAGARVLAAMLGVCGAKRGLLLLPGAEMAKVVGAVGVDPEKCVRTRGQPCTPACGLTAVPLEWGGKRVGEACVDPGALVEGEHLAVVFARGAAAFVRAVKRAEDVAVRARQWRTVVRLMRRVARPDDVAAAVREAARCVLEVTGGTACLVWVFGGEEENRLAVWAAGVAEKLFPRELDGVVAEAVRRRRPLLVRDLPFECLSDVATAAELSDGKISSVMCAPLFHGEGVFGAVEVVGTKPFVLGDLRMLAGAASALAPLIRGVVSASEMRSRYLELLRALAAAIDGQTSYTRNHSARVADYAELVAREMGEPSERVNVVKYAALLHDMGKVALGEGILTKRGSLDREEFATVRAHPVVGAELLEPVRFLDEVAKLVRYHHERYDGTGYAEGLRQEHIPLGSRIIAVADAFDAMTSDRPYRRALTVEQAVARLKRNSGRQFDPAVVGAFLRVLARQDRVAQTTQTRG